MKKILLILLLAPFTIFAQYAVADFIVINDGMDSQYNQLEKVWGAWHQNSIDNGEKTNWAVWKRTPKSDDGENAADYVVFNQFNSKEKMEDYINGSGDFSINGAISTMKSKLKGMSTSSIRKIVQSEQKIKKQVRTYHLQLLDATPLTGGDIKVGDKMTYAAMVQKSDDYEKVESFIAKLPEPTTTETLEIFLFNLLECLIYFKPNLFLSKSKKVISYTGFSSSPIDPIPILILFNFSSLGNRTEIFFKPIKLDNR